MRVTISFNTYMLKFSNRYKNDIEQPTFTKTNTPNDLDTTCLALQLVPHEDTIVQSLLDEMLEYLNPDGIIQV